MNTTIYVELSRQTALQRALDIAANNLANVDTVGFKLEHQLLQTEFARPPGAAQPTAFVLDRGVVRDFGPGAYQDTGAPLDLAIEGDAFFAVETEAGVRFTRDGRFTVDAQNRLTTKAGDLVRGAGGAPIVLNPAAGPPTIGKDGAINHGAAAVGQIETVRFADLSLLTKVGANMFAAPEEAQPIPAPDAIVRQGTLEGSNVQPILEITNLIEITRTYERVARLMDQAGDLATRAIERLGKAA